MCGPCFLINPFACDHWFVNFNQLTTTWAERNSAAIRFNVGVVYAGFLDVAREVPCILSCIRQKRVCELSSVAMTFISHTLYCSCLPSTSTPKIFLRSLSLS